MAFQLDSQLSRDSLLKLVYHLGFYLASLLAKGLKFYKELGIRLSFYLKGLKLKVRSLAKVHCGI